MSTYVSPVDPPDLGLLPTFRRLLRLWREQWRLGVFGLACSLVYTLISIAIPILISQAIDNAIDSPHKRARSSPPYLAAIVGLALLRFVINFNRRYATARIGIRIEARMRELLYQAYLRYPRAFYDRHATGQVLSRATNDLYPIRYFIGWGLVQGMQSVMMIIGVGIVLVARRPAARRSTRPSRCRRSGSSPPLRTARLAHLAPGAGAEGRRDRGRGRGRRRDRDGAGLRPRGRRARALRRQGRGRPLGRARPGRRRGARTCRASTTCPALSIAAVVFFGGRAVIDGQITIGAVRPLRDAPPAARLAARGDRLDSRPRAAGARLGRPQLRLARRDRAAARAGEPAPSPAGRAARRPLREA